MNLTFEGDCRMISGNENTYLKYMILSWMDAFMEKAKKNVSLWPFITNETDTTNPILVNKIHGLLISINSNSLEFDQKIYQFDRKLLLTEIGFFC